MTDADPAWSSPRAKRFEADARYQLANPGPASPRTHYYQSGGVGCCGIESERLTHDPDDVNCTRCMDKLEDLDYNSW